MTLEILLAFALTSFLIELTPGPNMTYLAIVSLGEGRSKGFATVVGVAMGLGIIGILAAFGLASYIAENPMLYQVLRWGGVAFLLYLAWDGWCQTAAVEKPKNETLARYFQRGLITNLLNPKAALFYISVLPSFFVLEAAISPLYQALLLTFIYVFVATVIHIAIVVLAGSLKPYLTNPTWEQRVRRLLSALLACVAVWFAFST